MRSPKIFGLLGREKADFSLNSFVQPALSWWTDYQAILARGRVLLAQDEAAAARDSHHSHGSPPVSSRKSPMQALSELRRSLKDPGVSRLVRECWARVPIHLLLMVGLLTVAASYINLRSITLHTDVIDALLPSDVKDKSTTGATVWGIILEMLALRLFDEVLDVALTVVSDELRSELEQRARIAFFQAVLTQPVADVDRVSGAELQRHLADAPFAIFDVTLIPVRLLRYCITLIGGIWAMVQLDWRLLLAAW